MTQPRIGTTIRRAMERKRMTQLRLAQVLGVSRSAVNAWINDRAYPQNSIGALEAVLGVSLAGDEPQPQPPVISYGLLARIRRELGEETTALIVAALEEASAVPRRGAFQAERPVQRPDQQREVVVPRGQPGAETGAGDPGAGDDDKVTEAETLH